MQEPLRYNDAPNWWHTDFVTPRGLFALFVMTDHHHLIFCEAFAQGCAVLTIPVSVKGIVVVDGRVLLLRNERDEWDLPGGRPDAAEAYEAAVVRETREEANVTVEALDHLDDWLYEVLPGRFVRILAYGCRVLDASRPVLSAEHRELRFFAPEELDGLRLHEGYRRAIDRWFARAIR